MGFEQEHDFTYEEDLSYEDKLEALHEDRAILRDQAIEELISEIMTTITLSHVNKAMDPFSQTGSARIEVELQNTIDKWLKGLSWII